MAQRRVSEGSRKMSTSSLMIQGEGQEVNPRLSATKARTPSLLSLTASGNAPTAQGSANVSPRSVAVESDGGGAGGGGGGVTRTAKSESSEEDAEDEMTLEMKARTLGYQLPTAEMEIMRLDELCRGFEERLQNKKKKLPTTQVNLAKWLERHPEVTLSELNLAESDKPIKSITVDDALGTGRYVMRGELKNWMETVEKLNSGVRLDAHEWDSDDEREVEDSLDNQMKFLLSNENKDRKRSITDLTMRLSSMLTFLSEREMGIDERLFLDEEAKLKQLVAQTTRWFDHVKKHGHPRVEVAVEETRAPTEEELRRRQIEHGLCSAAFGQGILLQPLQVDQVLAAFYEQKQPEASKKKDRSRVERRLVESLSREESKSNNFKNIVASLREQISTLEGTVYQQANQIEEMKKTRYSELRDPTAVENMNIMTKTVTEVLSRKKILEAEKEVAAVIAEYDALKVQHQAALETGEKLEKANTDLKEKVKEIAGLWKQHQLHVQQQEEERARLYGGHKDDKDHFISTICSVLGQTITAFMKIMVLFTQQDRAVLRCDLYTGEQGERIEAAEEFAKGFFQAAGIKMQESNPTPQSNQGSGSVQGSVPVSPGLSRVQSLTFKSGIGMSGSPKASPRPADPPSTNNALSTSSHSVASFTMPAGAAPPVSGEENLLVMGDRGGVSRIIPGKRGSITHAESERQPTGGVSGSPGPEVVSPLQNFSTQGGTPASGTPAQWSPKCDTIPSAQLTTTAQGKPANAAVVALTSNLGTALAIERRELSEYEAQRKSEKCGLGEARAIAENWANKMVSHALTDGLRISLQELVSLCHQNKTPQQGAQSETSVENSAEKKEMMNEGDDDESKAPTIQPLALPTTTVLQSPGKKPKKTPESTLSSNEIGGGNANIDKVDQKHLPRVALRDIDLENQHLTNVTRRLDTTLAELRTKYREVRYIRTTVGYLVECVEAMCNGSYDDATHAKREFESKDRDGKTKIADQISKGGKEEVKELFPPNCVTAPDSEYHYAWVEETKNLERMFLTLRHVLCDSGERADTSNALIGALEMVADDRGPRAPAAAQGKKGFGAPQVLTQMELFAQREAHLVEKINTTHFGEHQSLRDAIPPPQTVQVAVAQQKVLTMLNNMTDTNPGPDGGNPRQYDTMALKQLNTKQPGSKPQTFDSGTRVTPGQAVLVETHKKVFTGKDGQRIPNHPGNRLLANHGDANAQGNAEQSVKFMEHLETRQMHSQSAGASTGTGHTPIKQLGKASNSTKLPPSAAKYKK